MTPEQQAAKLELDALLRRYGLSHPEFEDDSVADCFLRMSPEDQAEFQRLRDETLLPEGQRPRAWWVGEDGEYLWS